MTKTLFGIVVLFILSTSCEKNNGFQNEGIISGYDYRKCMCCGGYFVEVEDSTYRFYVMPDDFNFDWETDTFPLNVLLDWRLDSAQCLGDEIIVERMERVK